MFELRDYQQVCHKNTLDYIHNVKSKSKPISGMVVAPTAHGKSLQIAKLAADYPDPVIVLCPSEEILRQNHKKYLWYGGEASIYSASLGVKEIGKVTFATLGSVKKIGREFKNYGTSLLVQDECHLFSDPSGGMLKTFLSHLQPKYMIGYTATPFRLKAYNDFSTGVSGSKLIMMNRTRPKIYSDIINVTQIQQLTARGYWAPVKYNIHDYDSTGLVLNSTGSEFTENSIKLTSERNNVNNRIYKLTKHLLKNSCDAILIFMDTVENCYIMANHLGDEAAVVEANTKKKERTKIISDFTSGKLKVLCCVSTLAIGFDYPGLKSVIMGRPTNSLAVFYQIYGRLVRPYEDKVGEFHDFGGNIGRFGYMESLTIENYNNTGWGVFSGDRLLTGVMMGAERVTKKDLDNMKTKSSFRHSDNIKFEFGKYKGSYAKDVPLTYLTWACSECKSLMSEKLFNDCQLQIHLKTTGATI